MGGLLSQTLCRSISSSYYRNLVSMDFLHLKRSLCFLPIILAPLTLSLDLYNFKSPALYVFGDSLVDTGNGIHLSNHSKAKYLPFGIDFPLGPTGRSSNGKLIVDFIAELLNITYAPPYLGLSKRQRRSIKTGINYASAGSGILNEDRNGTCFPLGTQISLFQKTVKNDLSKAFRSEVSLKKHLSESLFFISTGVNDYAHPPTNISSFPGAYAQQLLSDVSTQLQRLYTQGARKFLVNNIPPLGCFPNIATTMSPRGECDSSINKMISIYNHRLPVLLQTLQSQLPFSIFTHSDYYKFLLHVRANARHYGLKYTWEPCFPGGVPGFSDSDATVCENRDDHFFFEVHPTQIANEIYVDLCLSSSTYCSIILCAYELRSPATKIHKCKFT